MSAKKDLCPRWFGQEGIDWCRTALHEAAQYAENSDCLAILLAGRDLTTVNTKDLWGVTLLWLAVESTVWMGGQQVASRCSSVTVTLVNQSH